MKDAGADEGDHTYRSVMEKINAEVLSNAYSTMERVLNETEKYVETWFGYQALWDLESDRVYDSLQDNIERWAQLLNEVKRGRMVFDNSETEKHFGAIIIDYKGVQAKINNKYDAWHREILSRFGGIMLTSTKEFIKKITEARGYLLSPTNP